METLMKYLISVAMVFFAATVFGQGPAAEWDYKKYDDRSRASVKIEVNLGYGIASGTGSVILKTNEKHPDNEEYVKAYVITAAHVVEGAMSLKILFQSGITFEGSKVLVRNKKYDVALLSVYVHRDQPYLKLADTVKDGEIIRVCGYGGSLAPKEPRYHEAKVARVTSDKRIFFLYEDSIPGDSGGGITNEKGELVGVLSGGSAWFSNIKSNKFTWPTRCFGPTAIRDLVKNYVPTKLFMADVTPLPLNHVDLERFIK